MWNSSFQDIEARVKSHHVSVVLSIVCSIHLLRQVITGSVLSAWSTIEQVYRAMNTNVSYETKKVTIRIIRAKVDVARLAEKNEDALTPAEKAAIGLSQSPGSFIIHLHSLCIYFFLTNYQCSHPCPAASVQISVGARRCANYFCRPTPTHSDKTQEIYR